MSRMGDQSQWTAEQTLTYINNMVETAYSDQLTSEKERSESLYAALSISYDYLTNSIKRKITWSLSLEQLAYVFIALAFETNMHSSVKEVLKSYRSLTQGHYSDSLKVLLSNYRDKKLEAILEEEIRHEDIPVIRTMSSIEEDEVSNDMILASFKPELRRQATLRAKLRIVWEGYKNIIETVRVSQKLEEVYMATLSKIFEFVEKYNRKREFKAFCKSLRSGLQNAFCKREKSEQQKAIYIDIVKTEVNNRNIEIRMTQFKVATALGLWQEAFQVLEDINEIMKVRNVPVKNNLRCEYYENLAKLFQKSNYWHYHAYACYCAHFATLTNPRLTPEARQLSADRLTIAVLCIPPATLELHQTKESQEKICAMMIPSTKIPDRTELSEIIMIKGVIEMVSPEIRALWDFMSIEFTLGSLKHGLTLLEPLSEKNAEFKPLLEDVMAHRQLLWVAQIYECIKFSSLMKIIPLAQSKVEEIMLQCHREKLIDFVYDESQGILLFTDCTQEMNPYEELHSIFIETAMLREKYRNHDIPARNKKAALFMNEAHDYFENDREKRIEDYKIKLRQPKQELKDREKDREREENEKKEKREFERLEKEEKDRKFAEEAQKSLAEKKMIINDIIAVKGKKTVRILDKKVENLTNEEIENLSVNTLTENLHAIQRQIALNKEAKFRKIFTGVDYFERERRTMLSEMLNSQKPTVEEESLRAENIKKLSESHTNERITHFRTLRGLAEYLKEPIDEQLQAANMKYERDLQEYYQRLDDNFREKVKVKARTLFEEHEKRREMEQKERDENNEPEFWTRKEACTQETADLFKGGKPISLSRKEDNSTGNENTEEKWIIGKKANNQEESKTEEKTDINKNNILQSEEKSGDKWATGKNIGLKEEPKSNEKWATGKNVISQIEENKEQKKIIPLNINAFVPVNEINSENTLKKDNLLLSKKPEEKKEATLQTKYIDVNNPPTKKYVNVNDGSDNKKNESKKEETKQKGKYF